VSQLRLSFSVLVLSGLFLTAACGPQSEELPEQSTPSAVHPLQEAEVTSGAGPLDPTTAQKKCDKDPTRRYVSRNPEECPAILFFCEEGETAFFDECGCGCQAAQ
jgi:hypothetical protein